MNSAADACSGERTTAKLAGDGLAVMTILYSGGAVILRTPAVALRRTRYLWRHIDFGGWRS
ncbi:MAG: hypothetical protein JSS49_26565 [Planctomycetes bacterium]|nr:hypothetical protein [Planctomycetota bacterium]